MSTPPPLSPQPSASASPPTSPEKDRSDLRMLSIFYYVMAGLNLLAFLFYILIFGASIFIGMSPTGAMQGWDDPGITFLVIMLGVACVLMIASTALHFVVARSLPRHRRLMFCNVVAVLICLNIPVGTILGIYTLIVLSRPSVKALFEREAAM